MPKILRTMNGSRKGRREYLPFGRDCVVSLPVSGSQVDLLSLGRLAANGLLDQAEHIAVRAATRDEIMLAHSSDHYRKIESTACEPASFPSF